jgi:hypothetical protein
MSCQQALRSRVSATDEVSRATTASHLHPVSKTTNCSGAQHLNVPQSIACGIVLSSAQARQATLMAKYLLLALGSTRMLLSLSVVWTKLRLCRWMRADKRWICADEKDEPAQQMPRLRPKHTRTYAPLSPTRLDSAHRKTQGPDSGKVRALVVPVSCRSRIMIRDRNSLTVSMKPCLLASHSFALRTNPSCNSSTEDVGASDNLR